MPPIQFFKIWHFIYFERFSVKNSSGGKHQELAELCLISPPFFSKRVILMYLPCLIGFLRNRIPKFLKFSHNYVMTNRKNFTYLAKGKLHMLSEKNLFLFCMQIVEFLGLQCWHYIIKRDVDEKHTKGKILSRNRRCPRFSDILTKQTLPKNLLESRATDCLIIQFSVIK